jgi:hypothetical protein
MNNLGTVTTTQSGSAIVLAQSPAFVAGNSSVTYALTGAAADTAVTFVMVGATDMGGNIISPNPTTLSFTKTKTDTTAPKIDNVANASNNIRVIVNFTDDHGIDKASAETLANFAIVSGSSTLEINSIIAKDADDDDYYDQVEISTAAQENGAKYTLKINNLVTDQFPLTR